MKTILKNEHITVKETGRDYDFVATIENNTKAQILITFTNDYEYIEPIKISPQDWVGIEASDEGYTIIVALMEGKYKTETIND